MFVGSAAFGDNLAKEHEKAAQGGYDDDLKDSINKYGGSRFKEGERKYQQKQEEDKQVPKDTAEDYGRSYQEK